MSKRLDTQLKNQNRRDFLRRAGVVAVAVSVPRWATGCAAGAAQQESTTAASAAPEPAADERESSIAALEANGVFTADSQGKWEGKAGSHAPVVSFSEGQVSLVTKHGMSPEHFITAHYVRDQDGTLLGMQAFTGEDSEASSSFALPAGTTAVVAYSHCNLHDDWSTSGATT